MLINHFDVPSVKSGAHLNQIVAAWKRLFRKSHSDRIPSNNRAANRAADETSQGTSRKNLYAVLPKRIGVFLGSLTTISFSLFLVWTFSDSGPLGILRPQVKQIVVFDDAVRYEFKKKEAGQDAAIKTFEFKSIAALESLDKSVEFVSDNSGLNQQSLECVGQPFPSGKADHVGKQNLTINGSKLGDQSDLKEEFQFTQTALFVTFKLNDKRLPIPPMNEVAKAKTKIAAVFKRDYENAKKLRGETRLEKLRLTAADVMKLRTSESSPAELFAIFQVAIDIYRESCFVDETLSVVDRFEQTFEIDVQKIRLKLFEFWRSQLPLLVRSSEKKGFVFQSTSNQMLPFLRQAVAEQEWELAKEYSECARKLCQGAGNRQMATKLQKLGLQLAKYAKEEKYYLQAKTQLQENKEDPAKNLIVGKYLCFVAQDWSKGIPSLLNCGNSTLVECAKKDSEAANTSHLAAGDAWWELSSSKTGKEFRSALISRALYHYIRTDTKNSALLESKMAKRIVEAKQLLLSESLFVDQLNDFRSPTTQMEFTSIPSGRFEMGETEKNRASFGDMRDKVLNETPRHEVTISKAFLISKHEVSQRDWYSVMRTRPWLEKKNVRTGGFNAASCVSWNKAKEFCERLSSIDGHRYRLPTEAEWEYSCRAGSNSKYTYGDDESLYGEFAWFKDNAWNIPEERFPRQVGLKKYNRWGLFDIHGNVYEWCEDNYSANYYSKSAKIDPLNQEDTGSKVFRGGSIDAIPFHGRSARRAWAPPDYKAENVGFRVVREF